MKRKIIEVVHPHILVLTIFTFLEFSPREYAASLAKKASSIDVNNVRESIASAGTKISTYLQDLQVRKIP